MIGKVLGLKKKSDYVLEFDDAKGSTSAATQPAAVEMKVAPVEIQPAAVEMKVAPVETQPAPVEAKVQEEAPAPAKKSKKATTKKAKAKPAETPEVKEPTKVAPPKELPSFNQGLEPTPAGMTFATDYLMKPSSAGRRRPGPSMKMFTDMARQVGRR